MRRIAILAGVAALALTSTAAAQDYTLRAGHGAMTQHPTHFGLERLAEVVAERTDGAVQIDVYPDRQLGEEREMVEGLQLGTVDITVVSTGPLGGFVPEINVVDLPFLFEDSEHVYRVLDGDIGRSLLDQFSEIDIEGLAFWENGWRHLTTRQDVSAPEDLSGIRLRTMENQVHMDAFEALGAAPMPMVWGEVYTSLDQGVIDAQENPITVIYTNQLWEVQDVVTLTGHVYGPHVVLASSATMSELPEEYQEVIREAAREVANYQRQVSAELEAEQIELLQEEGMEIREVDTAPFRERIQEVYEKYSDQFGADLIQAILDAN